ncbi:hypothetical protein BDZ94DRAFT_1232892 [Collybia nuda]|uniref:Uncharacterized protein n=1 Tax=Collybia nuda TaxID=64659 RepID=A0A9P5YFB8_9AGAR|nr:hypothetical protein BDZ94DRAFT_1232892 [Collybia nuda]
MCQKKHYRLKKSRFISFTPPPPPPPPRLSLMGGSDQELMNCGSDNGWDQLLFLDLDSDYESVRVTLSWSAHNHKLANFLGRSWEINLKIPYQDGATIYLVLHNVMIIHDFDKCGTYWMMLKGQTWGNTKAMIDLGFQTK